MSRCELGKDSCLTRVLHIELHLQQLVSEVADIVCRFRVETNINSHFNTIIANAIAFA